MTGLWMRLWFWVEDRSKFRIPINLKKTLDFVPAFILVPVFTVTSYRYRSSILLSISGHTPTYNKMNIAYAHFSFRRFSFWHTIIFNFLNEKFDKQLYTRGVFLSIRKKVMSSQHHEDTVSHTSSVFIYVS